MNSTDKKVLKFNYETRADWKATMLHHQAKNIIYVIKLSGYGNIKNNLLYVTIESTIFGLESIDEFSVKVA